MRSAVAFVRALTVASAAFLTGCGSSPSASPTGPTPPSGAVQVRVFGRVIDFTTNAPVSGAHIAFYTPPLPVIAASVVTDASGSYDVSLTRGVKYNPRINGPDVDSNRGTILPIAKETQADYLINGGTCIVIYGTVRDAVTGAPVSGADIRFVGLAQQTGNDGAYRLDLGCPTPANPWKGTGTTFMTVTRPGYVTQSPYGNRSEFLPGAHTQRIDVALQPES